ncbi:MAG: membrane protein insertase YidC [Actinomycetota bacterium]|nr:membrane protein insertase YidC [Actinomycetota bacterium]
MLEIANVLQPIIDGSRAILEFWHGIVGSWGAAIILLTFTIRLLILPLTFKSVKSMQKLQVLQPEMKKIQERFKEDRQRMNQEMMKFYQENKVNPLGSCLPLLLQIPFFIALFYLLRSEEFKADIEGAESFLFIPDLAAPLTDEPLILAFMIVLYVGTQLIASLITMVGGDKTQQRIMLALPFVFVIFIINFEAGLIVYWITTNVWTIGQQLVVRKLYPRPVLLAEGGADAAKGGADAAKESKSAGKPARGKAAQAGGTAVVASSGNGGGASRPPPGSPRKKKKRSGRRR